jgi:hypothetical protein
MPLARKIWLHSKKTLYNHSRRRGAARHPVFGNGRLLALLDFRGHRRSKGGRRPEHILDDAIDVLVQRYGHGGHLPAHTDDRLEELEAEAVDVLVSRELGHGTDLAPGARDPLVYAELAGQDELVDARGDSRKVLDCMLPHRREAEAMRNLEHRDPLLLG